MTAGFTAKLAWIGSIEATPLKNFALWPISMVQLPFIGSWGGEGSGGIMNTIVRSPDHTGANQFLTNELRFSVMVKGMLFNDDFPDGLSLRILNISEGGIMAAIPFGVRVYSAVTIALRNLPAVSGHVAWCRKDRIGVAFDEKIDLDLFFGRKIGGEGLHMIDPASNAVRSEPLIRKLNG